MKYPLISLIMPVYNGEYFLSKTIDSILNQTFTEFELIIVDDGSSDSTLEILDKYRKKDARIRLYFANHSGAAIARNRGIVESRGFYISFVDSDDIYKKNMLSNLYTKAVITNADIVICGFRKFDHNSNKTLWEFHPDGKFLIEERINTKEHVNHLFSVVPPSPWGKLIKKSLIINNGIEFQNLTSCNDFAFTYSTIARANTIAFCPEVLLYYRANTGKNISANRGEKATNIILAIAKLKENLLKNQKFSELKNTFIERSKKSIEFELSNCTNEEKDSVIKIAKNYLDEELLKIFKLDNYGKSS